MCLRRVAGAVFAAGIVLLTAAPGAGAVTWRPVQTGSTDPITAIEYRSPEQLWFATGAGNIFVRQPGGAFTVQGSFPGRQFFDIAFRPSGDIGLAGADSGQLFRFAGGAWAPVSLANASIDQDCPDTPQPPYARVTPTGNLVAVAWSSDTVAWAATATEGQLLKSVDAGATWTDVSRQPDGTCRLSAPVSDIAPIPGSEGDVYFVTTAGGLWRTIDGLASPAAFKLGTLDGCANSPIVRLGVDPAGPNRVSTAGDCLLTWAFSSDAGASKHYIDPISGVPHDIAAGPGVFLWVGDNGVIKQTFDGTLFNKVAPRGSLGNVQWLSADFAGRDRAAVGGAGGVLILSEDAGPGPGISGGSGGARRSRGRIRVRIRGRLTVPAGIPRAAVCRGRVLLTIKRGKRTIAARNANVRSSCRFSKTATLSARAVGGARTLRVTVRYGGNAQLGVRIRTFTVRVRR
jgi:hypothetical protein